MKKILTEIYAVLLCALIFGCILIGLAIAGGVEIGTIQMIEGIKELFLIAIIFIMAVFGMYGLYQMEKAKEEDMYIKRAPDRSGNSKAHKKNNLSA